MSKAKRYALQANGHISLQGSALSSWRSSQQPSLHDARIASAIKVGPGSYRVVAPKIPSSVALAVSRIIKPTSASDTSEQNEEQEPGSSRLAADIACFKKAAVGQKRIPRKRVYFPEVPDDVLPRKSVRMMKTGNSIYSESTGVSAEKLMSACQCGAKTNDTIVVDADNASEIIMDPDIDVDGYEEVTVAEEYDEAPGNITSPYMVLEGREMITGASFRELKGENTYLKEQLHASVLRVKQLEALLLERNSHVKNLVSENLQLSIKCRKLINALGEEEAKEALA
ncbi:unnamed protein product [Cylicocyclus nassatus]|uniref:Uncharacterized protein n=1 Tax=Cylicocyclus nassatus TaxID=53992 RepID=A0AA36MC10_CYLNA|nr:unnamed protein product [Cylicocyclus nassatus]